MKISRAAVTTMAIVATLATLGAATRADAQGRELHRTKNAAQAVSARFFRQ